MTITLTSEQEAIINHKLAEGDFADAGEVLDVALHLLSMPGPQGDPLLLEQLRCELAVAVEQEERGEEDLLDAEAIKAEGRRLLAAKQGSR